MAKAPLPFVASGPYRCGSSTNGRNAESTPLLAELRQRLLAWKEQLLPRHPMAKAIAYALSQWNELMVYCTDGAIPIDNNLCTAARGSVQSIFSVAARRQSVP